MSTKSNVALSFGLVLATISAAAASPHHGNFRLSHLALAQIRTPAVQQEQWFNHQTARSMFYMGKGSRSLFETNF